MFILYSFSYINSSVHCVPVIDDVALLIKYSVMALQDANCTYMPAFRIWHEHKRYINSAGWTVTVLSIKLTVFTLITYDPWNACMELNAMQFGCDIICCDNFHGLTLSFLLLSLVRGENEQKTLFCHCFSGTNWVNVYVGILFKIFMQKTY